MNIGKLIKELREEYNLNQEQLAEKLKVKNYTIGDWERARSQPSIEQLRQLCVIFDISADELLEMDEFKKTFR